MFDQNEMTNAIMCPFENKKLAQRHDNVFYFNDFIVIILSVQYRKRSVKMAGLFYTFTYNQYPSHMIIMAMKVIGCLNNQKCTLVPWHSVL